MSTEFPKLFCATVLNGQSLSAAVAIGPYTLVGISMPAAWTAASMTFQVSQDGGATMQELQTSAAPFSLTVAAGEYIGFDPAQLLGVTYVKVRSGTSGAPVVQGADRIVTLVTRPMA